MGCTIYTGRIAIIFYFLAAETSATRRGKRRVLWRLIEREFLPCFGPSFFFLFFCTRSVWTAGRRIIEKPSVFFFIPRGAALAACPHFYPLCVRFFCWSTWRQEVQEGKMPRLFFCRGERREGPLFFVILFGVRCVLLCAVAPAVGILCCSFLSLSFFWKGFFLHGGVLIYLSFYSELIRFSVGVVGLVFFCLLAHVGAATAEAGPEQQQLIRGQP